MKKVAVLLCALLAGCANGQTIYMTNGAGDKVACGPYQTASIPDPYLMVAATMANNQMQDCIQKHQQAGYQIVVPERTFKIVGYAFLGPLRERGFTGPIEGTIVAQGAKGHASMLRPDGIACTGNFVTMTTGGPAVSATVSTQGGAGTGSLLVTYQQQIGIAINTDSMVKGLATGGCSDGATFDVEYYVARGTDNVIGVARDSDGNVYKVMSE